MSKRTSPCRRSRRNGPSKRYKTAKLSTPISPDEEIKKKNYIVLERFYSDNNGCSEDQLLVIGTTKPNFKHFNMFAKPSREIEIDIITKGTVDEKELGKMLYSKNRYIVVV